MALEKWMYKDPCEVIERAQSIGCAGCKHEAFITFEKGGRQGLCELGKLHSDQGGRKCRKFREVLK